MWVLGIEPGSSTRTESPLNHWTFSSAPNVVVPLLKIINRKLKIKIVLKQR